MIRHPYGPDELDRTDPDLDAVAEQLQAFASDQRAGPPIGLAPRIHAAIDAAPDPAFGWWARFAGPLAPWATPARGLAAAAVVAAAVVVALVVGDLADLIRGPISPGTTPSPSVIVTPSPSPTPSPSITPPTSPSPVPSPTQSPRPTTPAPSASDDDDGGQTPEPSESDSSGPGGGGGDNSGPGSDNSGPGGGDD
jgi:hypothetical protein